MVASFVVSGCFAMVPSGVFVVLRSLEVMFRSFLGHSFSFLLVPFWAKGTYECRKLTGNSERRITAT